MQCARSGYTAFGDKQSMVSVEVTRYGVFRLQSQDRNIIYPSRSLVDK